MKMSFWVGLLVVALAATNARCDTVVLNEAIDELLQSMRQELVAKGKDVLPIKDFSKDWHVRWHFISVSGNFNCQGGKAGKLTSLQRTGDVTMTTTPNTLTLTAKMGIGNLYADFDNCQLKIHNIGSAEHSVTVSDEGNSVSAQITLHHDGPTCVASLDHISLDNIGNIHVRIGPSLFEKFLDKITDSMIEKFSGEIKDSVNEQLLKVAQSQIGKVDLCKKIPH